MLQLRQGPLVYCLPAFTVCSVLHCRRFPEGSNRAGALHAALLVFLT